MASIYTNSRISSFLVAALLSLTLVGCDVELEADLSDENGNPVVVDDDGHLVVDDGQFDKAPGRAFCDPHNPYLTPGAADFELCRETYSIGYNVETKQADWVSYFLVAESVAEYVARTDDFREDEDLPETARSTLDHYSGSGYVM